MSGGFDRRGPSARTGSSSADHNGGTPGKHTRVEALQSSALVQCKAERSASEAQVDDPVAIARQGVSGSGGQLTHLDTIQRSFGPAHDISQISAQTIVYSAEPLRSAYAMSSDRRPG